MLSPYTEHEELILSPYTEHEELIPHFLVTDCVAVCLIYKAGSMAFGTFLIKHNITSCYKGGGKTLRVL